MNQTDSERTFDRRTMLKTTGALAATATIGGVASAGGGSCSQTEEATATGTLAGGETATHAYAVQMKSPCSVQIDLRGDDGTDFDLYATADGRTPSPYDYDYRSFGYGSRESIEVGSRDLSAGGELGILVRSYSGEGEYELSITEKGSGASSGRPGQEFRVRVENVAPPDFYPSDSATGGAILITPGAYAVHHGRNPILPAWYGASDGLEAIAEAGRPGGTEENSPGLVTELQEDDAVVEAGAFTPEHTVKDPNDPKGSVPGIPPIAPGGAFEFTVSGTPGDRFSFASMFVPSNDIFFSPTYRGIPLFDGGNPIEGDVTRWVDLYDAGTEPNQRPGFGEDGAPLQKNPDQGDDEGGLVTDLDWVYDGYDYPDPGEAIEVTVEPVESSGSLLGGILGR